MDRELAEAVFVRWGQGLPVYEGTLYKAASVLGADPGSVLTEARFYHHLDRALDRGTGFTEPERQYFSAAAGYDHDQIEKTAEVYPMVGEDTLIVRALQRRGFQPDLEKLAMMGMEAGPADAGGAMMDPSMMGADPAAGAAPQPGAQLQQNPMVRPSPTAPAQVPSQAGGNLQQLLGDAGQTPGADANGGLPPAGAGATGEAPQQPTAADRLAQAMPGIPPDAVERYAPKLEEFEQQIGMTVMDPKQVEKFIKEMQKSEKKLVDEAMKQYAEQQAEAMGVGGGAAWDETAPVPNGSGGSLPGAGGGDAAGGGQEQQPPQAGAEAAPPTPPGGAGPAGMPNGAPKPKKPSPQQGAAPQPAASDGVAKVAAAGVILARSIRR